MISTQASSQRGPSSLKRIRQCLRSFAVRAAVLGCWLLAMVSYQVLGHQPKRNKPKQAESGKVAQAASPVVTQRSFVVPQAPAGNGSVSLSTLQPQPPTTLR